MRGGGREWVVVDRDPTSNESFETLETSSSEESISELEADCILTESAELGPASSLSLPGLRTDFSLASTGTVVL